MTIRYVKYLWSVFPTMPFWKKVGIFYSFLFGSLYLANDFAEVPFFRQKNKKGEWYHLPNGTKCFMFSQNLMLSLEDGRWLAVGDSEEAKKLNREVDQVIKRAEHFNAEEYFASVKAEMDNKAEDLIRQEIERVNRSRQQEYNTDSSS